MTGPVTVSRSEGPVIGGNRITGALTCLRNDPPPVNHGSPNAVKGKELGQCKGL